MIKIKAFLAILLTIFLGLLIGCTTQADSDRKVNVVFRYDDYSFRSSTEIEQKVIDLFQDQGIAITFGVIPFNVTAEDVTHLPVEKENILKTGVENGVIDVALHGFSHQTINAEYPTEFSGREYKDQVELLSEGKQYLENITHAPITTFIPPWERYDLDTLRALEALQFSTISAGSTGDVITDSQLHYLPHTTDLGQLQDAVEIARKSSDMQPVIVVLLHPYDFLEVSEERGSITFPVFSYLVNWVTSQSDVRILSIDQATKTISGLDANRFQLNIQNCSRIVQYLPSTFRGTECQTQYQYQEPSTVQIFLKIGAFYTIILCLSIGFAFIAGYFIFPRSTTLTHVGTFGSIVLSIIILIYSFYDLQIYWRGLLLSMSSIGLSIGLFISYLYVKGRKSKILN